MSNEGILKECNDGAIVARSLGVDGKYFMSQLNVTVTSGILIGETILCVHDNSTQSRITFSTAIPTTGKIYYLFLSGLQLAKNPFFLAHVRAVHQSPCNSIHINTVILSANEFSFNWSPALVNDCPVILYNILTSNCGICPTNSTHTNVTCIDVPVNSGVCTFTIQTVICGKVVVNSIAVNNIISAVITAEDSVVTQQEGMLSIEQAIVRTIVHLIQCHN